jgi:hypothetical protein
VSPEMSSRRPMGEYAILGFAAPPFFFLAGLSARFQDRSKVPPWIASAVTIFVLSCALIPLPNGWTLFAKTAGPIVSFIFLIGLPGWWASSIAAIATAIYGVRPTAVAS